MSEDYSNTVSVTTENLTPGTLSEVSQTNSSVTVSWTDATNGTGTVNAQLQRSDDGSTGWTDVTGATSSPATVSIPAADRPKYLSVLQTDDVESVRSNVLTIEDDTLPLVTSLRIVGMNLYANFSEDVEGDFAAGLTLADFSGGALTIDSGPADIGGASTAMYVLNREVDPSETPGTADYDSGTGTVTDMAGNALASFSGMAVTVGGGGFSSDGVVFTDTVFSPLVYTRDIYPESVFD